MNEVRTLTLSAEDDVMQQSVLTAANIQFIIMIYSSVKKMLKLYCCITILVFNNESIAATASFP